MTSPANRNDIGYTVRTAAGATVDRRVNPAGEYLLEPGDQLVRVWAGDEPPMLRMLSIALEADWRRAEEVSATRSTAALPAAFALLRNATMQPGSQPLGPFGYVKWQDGVLSEVGINGTTIEDVTGVLIARLREFQAGPYACFENELAIARYEEARHALEVRTEARRAQGVEGTMQTHTSGQS